MGGSKSKSSSRPVDMTPGAFKDLQGPFADVVGNLIGQYVPTGTQKIMQGYQGPTTAPITGAEQGALGLVNQAATGGGQFTQTPTGGPPGTGGAMQTPNFIQNAINQAMQPAPTAPGISQTSQDLLSSTAATGGGTNAANFIQSLGIGQPQGSLTDFRGNLGAASQTGAFGGANNPFLQQAIEAAQRPTLQGLEETLSRTLPGRFTQAGHIIQPGGSSAFDRAAAIASRGATQELGDIATRMSYNAFEAAAGREASALENELARRGEGTARRDLAVGQQLDRALQIPGLEAQIQNLGANTNLTLAQLPTQAAETALRLSQARGQEAGTGLTQAQTGTQQAQTDLTRSQVQGQEVDTAIKNLQAQALPRLIEDLGVERGIEAFNNNVNSLLATLGIASGVTRPVVANESKSSSGSFNLK